MKKKILLFICLVTVASLSFAQEITQDWSSSLGELRGKDNIAAKDLVHIDANGNTYVYGSFSEYFTIGNTELEPIGNSAYLAKLDNTGKVEWAVALQGNVTPAYMTTDAEGNLYLTGSSDGESVILQSTDGTSKKLTGNDHALWSQDANTLLAKYDTNGILKEGKIFLHDNSGYTNEVLPMGLTLNNGSIYLALNIIGETTIDGSKFSGTTATISESTTAIGVTHILSFDNSTLNLQKEIASITPENAIDDWSISSFAMTSNENNTYIAFIAPAKQKVMAGTSSFNTDFNYEYNEADEWYEYQRGICVFKINAEGNIDIHKSFQSENKVRLWAFGYETIDQILIKEDSWIIAGNYNGKFVFNEEAPATSTYSSAPYFTLLNKNTADSQKSYFWEEGNVLNYAAAGNALILCSTNSTNETSTLKAYDFGTQNVTDLTTTEAGTSINGVASTGAKVAISKATAGAEVATLTVSMNTLSGLSGINSSSVNTIDVKVYPNPVTDVLNFSEVCDVTITNIQGSEIKVASTTTQIAVADLAAGYYVAKIKTSNGIAVIPFIKK